MASKPTAQTKDDGKLLGAMKGVVAVLIMVSFMVFFAVAILILLAVSSLIDVFTPKKRA